MLSTDKIRLEMFSGLTNKTNRSGMRTGRNPSSQPTQGRGGAGAYPSCHWVWGRVHPGQVASPSQQDETRRTISQEDFKKRFWLVGSKIQTKTFAQKQLHKKKILSCKGFKQKVGLLKAKAFKTASAVCISNVSGRILQAYIGSHGSSVALRVFFIEAIHTYLVFILSFLNNFHQLLCSLALILQKHTFVDYLKTKKKWTN